MHRTAPRANSRRGRATGRFAALGTASVLAALLLAGCTSSGTPAPESSSTPTAEAAAPRPTPSDAPSAQPVGTVIPATCDKMYLPRMLSELERDYPPLNDPTMADPNFSNNDDLEELLRSLKFLQCTWGLASETGIVTAVAHVTEEQSSEILGILEDSDFACNNQQEGRRCVIREDADGNRIGETHFVRDGIWMSTLWVNAPVRGYTENMIEALWG